MSAGLNADRHEDGTVPDTSGHTDFLVAGIQDQVLDLIERTIPPGLELFVEQLCGSTDLRAGDFQSAEFGRDFRDFSCRYSLDIHFGDGQLECSFAAFSSFES